MTRRWETEASWVGGEEGGKERRRGEEKGGGERVFNGILPLILDDAQTSWPTFSGSLGEVEHSRYHGQN